MALEIAAAVIGSTAGAVATWALGTRPAVEAKMIASKEKDAAEQRALSAEAKHTRLEEAISALGRDSQDGGVFRVKLAEKEFTLHDDGSAVAVMKYRGLTTTHHFENMAIPYFSRIGGPGAKLSKPEVKEMDNSALAVRLDSVETLTAEPGVALVRARLRVSGAFMPTSGPVHYKVVQRSEGAACMTRDACLAAYQGDTWQEETTMFGAEAGVWDRAILSIKFPPSIRDRIAPPTAVAFIRGTECSHRGETARIAGSIEYSDGTARLEIDRPLTGIAYGISWLPP